MRIPVTPMIDPICGMTVDEANAIKATREGRDYFFCSSYCRDKFLKKANLFKNKVFIVSAIAVLLVLVSFFIPLLAPFRNIFLVYIKKIWWAVSLGLLLGGVIDYYVPKEYISKILSRRSPFTIFNAVLTGFLMSACSHGILALSIQLHKKGASNPAVISFLLASPWANIAITLMLLSFFGLKGLFIIFSAIIIAINTGFIFMFLEKKGLIEKNKNSVEVTEGFSILKDIKARAKNYKFNYATLKDDSQGVLNGAVTLGNMVLWWIIIGVLIASFAGAYIPVHFFHRFMGPTFLGLIVTLGLATIIEVCSEGSSPLAFEIYKRSGALGNSLVFLMAGVATDYTEIGLLWSNLGRRVAFWLPLVAVPQVLIFGYLANLILK